MTEPAPAELEDVLALEAVLRETKEVLEARLVDQTEQLRQSNAPGRAEGGKP